MEIQETEYAGLMYCDRLYCSAHYSPATYVLRFDGCLIPMCQTCIDELYEEILPKVSTEVRDKSN